MKIKRICEQCGKEFETHSCYLKRGGGRFCSLSCSTTYRNLKENPAKRPEVRAKISQNHADVSGAKNPMYGVRGKDAPSYIDGRKQFKGETYRRKLLAQNSNPVCSICGASANLHVHHLDGNRKNNDFCNLVWLCSSCHNNKAHIYKRNEKGQFIGSVLNEKVVML